MNQSKTLSVIILLMLCGSIACAQPFAEGAEEAGGDFVGPQGVKGRETRTAKTPERAGLEQESASEPADGDAESSQEGWLHWERLTGDWGGHRRGLESSGITIESSLIGEWSGVVDGGVRSHSSSRVLYDLNLTLDLETMFGVDGASVFADLYWIDGDSLSADAGDIQGASNIESEDRLQLAELWYEQMLFDDSIRIKMGKIEGNSEFGFLDAAADFVNSSAGLSPTLLSLPTYPDPSTGVVISWMPNDRFSLTGGFMDGSATVDGLRTGLLGPSSFFDDDRSDDSVWLGEANFFWDSGRAGLGIWHHTGDFTRFLGGTSSGTSGVYALAEHRVWSPGEERGIDLFAQFGWADEEVSDIQMHLGGGVNWAGPMASRGDDAMGLYVSFVDLSSDAGYSEDETVFELFYKAQLTPFFSVKPDVQYIINPSGDPAIDNAIVIGVRLETVF